MKTDANFGNNPDLLRAYENIFNDELAGQTEQRKRVRLLPTGMEPVQFDGYGERFKDTLDNYLVHSICGHYGVLPSEIGFSSKGGLGQSGLQEGEAMSGEMLGANPTVLWLSKMLTNLSYVYLGMPRELEFKFMESGRQDLESIARTRDIETKSGSLTLNESRSRGGMPLIESPVADMPMIVTGTGGYFVTLIASSPSGCTDSLTQFIGYQEPLIYYVPNTFTPDQDQFNQQWKPIFTSGFDPYDYHLSIFNRWGELIWESFNDETGWDGVYGTDFQAQEGIYTWEITFATKTNTEKQQITGTLNLLR
jgi:gliding motility-associated-like protein